MDRWDPDFEEDIGIADVVGVTEDVCVCEADADVGVCEADADGVNLANSFCNIVMYLSWCEITSCVRLASSSTARFSFLARPLSAFANLH